MPNEISLKQPLVKELMFGFNTFANLSLKYGRWRSARIEAKRLEKKHRSKKKYHLGVLAIMKNEAMNIDEWVQHYVWQGVDQIYLIDNGSNDASVALAQKWVDKGVLKLIILEKPWRQKRHYWKTIQHFKIRNECEWLMVADLDEFWFCKDPQLNLSQALEGFDFFDVIYTNWSIFGSSGHDAHPVSIRRDFLMRQEKLGAHTDTKWICRTAVLKTRNNIGIHKIKGVCSSRTLSDNQLFQINHYVIQSLEYFKKIKMTRGDATTRSKDDLRSLQYFHDLDATCTQKDQLLADFLPA